MLHTPIFHLALYNATFCPPHPSHFSGVDAHLSSFADKRNVQLTYIEPALIK